MFAIRLTDIPGGLDIRLRDAWVGSWLVSYDPDAFDGLGEARFSSDVTEAARFDSFDDAKACWFQPSTLRPKLAAPLMVKSPRTGRYEMNDTAVDIENRPLAACSIHIEQI